MLDQADDIDCVKCGARNPAEMLFCGKCGSTLRTPKAIAPTIAEDAPPQKCWKCGSMMPSIAVFCGVCGLKLGSSTNERDRLQHDNCPDQAGVGSPAAHSDGRSLDGANEPWERPGLTKGKTDLQSEADATVKPLRPEGSIREMVLIPAGKYPVGSDGDEGNQDERPRHIVELSSFFIDRFAVSNAEYELFDPSHASLRALTDSSDDDPVVFVTYGDCEAYCRWRSKQEGVSEGTYRLPTEAQWEVVARGGTLDQTYPWGDEINITICNTREGRRGRAVSVGKGVPNGYGILHIGDNIREWCLDWYMANYYAQLDASGRNPSGPAASAFGNRLRVVRGASYQDSANQLGRCAARNYCHPNSSSNDTGFRCVRLLSC